MSKKLIPAPIDEKNVTSDWIEEIFDDNNYTYDGRNMYVGFVMGSVCCCMYHKNRIFWQIVQDFAKKALESYNELLRRLREHDEPPIVVKYDTSLYDRLLLLQQFYFEDE